MNMNLGEVYWRKMASIRTTLREDARKRIDFYSDNDLVRTYKSCEAVLEGNPEIFEWEFDGLKIYSGLPVDLHEGQAALDILRERNGRKYVERLTGIAETGFKGLLNKRFNISLRV
jgi:hypothetical protein